MLARGDFADWLACSFGVLRPAGAVYTLKARAMNSLSPVALLLTRSLAGQLREVVQLMLEGSSAAVEHPMSAVAVH